MSSISRNVYIDKLNNIVNEYHNRYHTTSKMKPVDLKSSLNLKMMVMWKYRNLKAFLQNFIF